MIEVALRAIADPKRLEILRLIRDRELSAGDISSYFDVTRPAISQHLKVLVDAGLVAVRSEGTRRLFKPRPSGLNELREYLEGFWSDRLEALKQESEAEERRTSRHDTPGN